VFDTFELNSDSDTRFAEMRVLMWDFQKEKITACMINVFSVKIIIIIFICILLGILGHGYLDIVHVRDSPCMGFKGYFCLDILYWFFRWGHLLL